MVVAALFLGAVAGRVVGADGADALQLQHQTRAYFIAGNVIVWIAGVAFAVAP